MLHEPHISDFTTVLQIENSRSNASPSMCLLLQRCLSGKDMGLIPGWGRFPGVGNGNPLQYPCMENSMEREAWQAAAHRGHKELDMTERTYWVQFLGGEDALEDEMATHSSLENPMDREAWQATVHRVTKSQTQLKWFSMLANIQLITLNINDLNTPSKKIGSDWEIQFNLPGK